MTHDEFTKGLARIEIIKRKSRENIDITPEEYAFWNNWNKTEPNKLMEINLPSNSCLGLGD